MLLGVCRHRAACLSILVVIALSVSCECSLPGLTATRCWKDNEWKDVYDEQLRGPAPQQRIPCFRYTSNATKENSSTGLFIAALIPLYEAQDETSSSSECLKPRHSWMMYFIEAAKLALDIEVERNPLGCVVSGIEFVDTCGLLQTSMEAVYTVLTRTQKSRISCEGQTWYGKSQAAAHRLEGCARQERIGAVLGPALSFELDASATILSAHEVPHVSYWATATAFQKKDEFPYLFRTATMDKFASAAIVDILIHFGWRYIHLLYNAPSAGRINMADEVRALLRQNGICTSLDESYERSDEEKLRYIANKIVDPPPSDVLHPQVIVLIAGNLYIRRLFEVIKTMAHESASFATKLHKSHLVWVGTDGWLSKAKEFLPPPVRDRCSQSTASYGFHSFIAPAFRIPRTFDQQHETFKQRLSERITNSYISEESVRRNPWLAVAWQDQFNCCLAFLPKTANCELCNVSKPIGEAFVSFPYPITAGSFWLALKALISGLQNTYEGVVRDRRNVMSIPGRQAWTNMRNVSLPCGDADSDEKCRVFETHQDSAPAFSIFALVHRNCGREIQQIGTWYGEENVVSGTIFMNWTRPSNGSSSIWADMGETPVSVCSKKCPPGTAQLLTHTPGVSMAESCCWTCVNCTKGFASTNGTSCVACDSPKVPNSNHTACVYLTVKYYFYTDPGAVAILSISLAVMVLVVICAVVFCKNRTSEVVQLSGFKQSISLLAVSLVSLALVLTTPQKPSTIYCNFLSIVSALTGILINILIVSRCMRLVALATNADTKSKWLRRLADRCAARTSSQLWSVASTFLVCTTIVCICLALKPSYVGGVDVAEVRYHFCALNTPFEVAAYSILFLLVFTSLFIIAPSRQLKLPGKMKSTATGPEEATLLFFLVAFQVVLYISLLLTSKISSGKVAHLTLGIAIILEVGSVLGIIHVPRVLAVLSWNRLNPADRKAKILKREMSHQRDKARAISRASSSRSNATQASFRSRQSSRYDSRINIRQNGGVRLSNGSKSVRHSSNSRATMILEREASVFISDDVCRMAAEGQSNSTSVSRENLDERSSRSSGSMNKNGVGRIARGSNGSNGSNGSKDYRHSNSCHRGIVCQREPSVFSSNDVNGATIDGNSNNSSAPIDPLVASLTSRYSISPPDLELATESDSLITLPEVNCSKGQTAVARPSWAAISLIAQGGENKKGLTLYETSL